MNTASFPIFRAHQRLGRDVAAWCRRTVRFYRLLFVLCGAIYALFLFALIALLATPYGA